MPRRPMDLQRATEMYEGGASVYEIGRELGVTGQAVYRRLAAAGVAIRPKGRPRAPVDSAELIRLRDQGWSWQRIADRFGLSPAGVVYRYETDRGPRPPSQDAGRPGGRPVVLTADKLTVARQLIDQGASISAAARTVGVSYATLHRGLARLRAAEASQNHAAEWGTAQEGLDGP